MIILSMQSKPKFYRVKIKFNYNYTFTITNIKYLNLPQFLYIFPRQSTKTPKFVSLTIKFPKLFNFFESKLELNGTRNPNVPPRQSKSATRVIQVRILLKRIVLHHDEIRGAAPDSYSTKVTARVLIHPRGISSSSSSPHYPDTPLFRNVLFRIGGIYLPALQTRKLSSDKLLRAVRISLAR